MSYIIPKIEYDNGSGPIELDFEWPVYSQDNDVKQNKNVNESGEGNREYILHYQNKTISFKVMYCKGLQKGFVFDAGSKMEEWQQFMEFALQGKSFKYYPDKSDVYYETVELDMDEWKPKPMGKGLWGHWQFDIKLRKYID